MEYDTLNIRFQPGREGSHAVVAAGPRGEAPGEFASPFADLDLENFLLRVGRPRRGVRRLDSPEMETAKTFGGKLFDALFRGEVRDLYHTASAEADSAGKGLRVTLRLGQAPELSDIPWEYLCEDGRFLSVSERTPIVRYLDLKKAHDPLALKLPLRILGMVSSPSDVVELNVKEEKRRLDQALERLTNRGQVEVVWLEQATLTALLEAVERDDFHIFHFIGHGAFDAREGDGVLLLEDEHGRGRRVTGMKLGQLLADERTLRLAVLNACEGARASREDPFAGVAASLVRNEIPSVVAMQFEITDQAAILFAGALYAALARGSPVDAALASARKAIWADYNDVEWGTPVLFMRIHDGRIFDIELTDAESVDSDKPDKDSLQIELASTPSTVRPGEEVAWRLTVRNVSRRTLSEITLLRDDASTLNLATELGPGRQSVTRWRTKPDADVDTTVTISAIDFHGDRIAEQVNAHVTVERDSSSARPSDGETVAPGAPQEEAAAAPFAHEEEERRLKGGSEATALSDRSLELEPHHVDALIERGWAQYGQSRYRGWEYYDRARAEKALQDFDRAVELEPNNAEALAGRGRVYLDTKRYAEALADFNRALELAPDHVEVLVGRGRLYYLTNRYASALADLNRALRLDPNHVNALVNRGWVRVEREQSERALADFNRALELDPTAVEAFDGRGWAYFSIQRNEEALADFKWALELSPGYVEAFVSRGQLYREMNRGTSALTDLNRALKLDPNHVNALVNRGWVRVEREQYQRALADFNRALELDPTYVEAFDGRGWSYLRIQRYEEAAADFHRALELSPNHVEALYSRSQLYYETDRYKSALTDLNRVLKLKPDHVNALVTRGLVREAQEQHEKALADFDRALELDPKQADARAGRRRSLKARSGR